MNKINYLNLIHKFLFKLPFLSNLKTRFNLYYQHTIFSNLLPYLNTAYKASKIYNKSSLQHNSGIIWIFWWQGYNNMPLIVKKCIQSIKQHSNSHKVILLNKNNLRKYTNIPKYIYNKVNCKEITLTHFSDIIRANLLHNHGGLWIDSTMYCTSNLTNNYFNHIFTSGGYKNPYHQFVSAKWTGFLLGGSKDSQIFTFIDDFFQIYWEHNTHMIDYFLLDYALLYAYKHNISDFRIYTQKKAWKNNPHLYSLVNNLNKPYNKNVYKEMTKDSNLFKLTYKQYFNNNKSTFYYKLIHDFLN